MATKTETSAKPEVSPYSEPRPWSLYQRLAAIASEVKVTATGTTGRQAGNQRAISIGDVDEALGPLFVKHGVVSDYEFLTEPTSFKVPTRDGEMTMWLAQIVAHMANIDDKGDSIVRKLADIGSNPSAAVSFALKRWYRALFKLVEDDDDAPAVGQTTRQQAAAASGNGPNGTADTAIPKTLQDLAYSLPSAWFPKKLTAMFASYGPDHVLGLLLKEHKTQCGEKCEHVPAEAKA